MFSTDTEISNFQEYLFGHKAKFHIKPSSLSPEEKEKRAYKVLQWIFEGLLQWSPEDAANHFSPKEEEIFKLKELLKYIKKPAGVPKDDYRYYVSQIYPDQIRYNTKENAIKVWKEVERGEKTRFDKDFFLGEEGELRKTYIMEYLLDNYIPASSLYDLYEKFSHSIQINKLLTEHHLHDSWKKTYVYPIELLQRHLVNADHSDDEFLFILFMLKNIGKFSFWKTKCDKQESQGN